VESWRRTSEVQAKMNDLAGGFYKGDRVACNGRLGTVFGKPARAACARISVAVMYDDGQMVDERVVNVSLLQDEPEPMKIETKQMDLPVYHQEEPDMPDLESVPVQGRRPVPPIAGFAPQETMEPRQDYTSSMYKEEYVPSPEDSPQFERPNLFDPIGMRQPSDAEADQMVDTVLEKIHRNYTNLRLAFRALDRSNNGYVSRADFFDALEHVFLTAGHSPQEVDEVAERFELHRGDVLSYDDFCQIVQKGEEEPYHQGADGLRYSQEPIEKEDRSDRARVEEVDIAIQAFKQIVDRRYGSMRDAFRALDKTRTSSLSPSEFAMGLSMHGVALSPNELQDAWDMFDPNQTGQISYADFCRVMSQRFQFGKHLRRQMYK